jgi:LysR family transcriptional regulator, benzoate and cis,cis-muconate-responsive activator of ben and cat genes
MELRHLRYFMAVGEELSFTRAAERLHIAQPPLSQQIKQLEEELGVTLLQRGARPLRLTGAGEVLLQRSRALLADLDAAMAETRRAGRGQTGKLSVGFAGSAMYVFLPDVINTFREACPNVELNLHEMLASEVAQALQEAEDRCRVRSPSTSATRRPEADFGRALSRGFAEAAQARWTDFDCSLRPR